MLGSFGWMELLLILFIVLIIFGAGKIPQLGEGLGKAIKGFKKSIHEPDIPDATKQAEEQSQLPHQRGQNVPDESLRQNESSSSPHQQNDSSQHAVPIHRS